MKVISAKCLFMQLPKNSGQKSWFNNIGEPVKRLYYWPLLYLMSWSWSFPLLSPAPVCLELLGVVALRFGFGFGVCVFACLRLMEAFSVTRYWNKKVAQFFLKLPQKVTTAVLLKKWWFHSIPKVTKHLGYFWKIICHRDGSKFHPIWSHWRLWT